jgi:hypothetical protein
LLRLLLSEIVGSFRRSPAPAASAELPADNPLAEYFFSNPGRFMDKWLHYFEIYHRHFARFRGAAPVVVEIGVHHGGSLEMWRHYFGAGARIVGIDNDPACAKFGGESIEVMIGDQADRGFLAEVRRRVPHVDILIDDGGHTMQQQLVSFEELYPHVQPLGVYLCEDLHTSYLAQWGGGHARAGTFIERAKTLVDQLHAWHSAEPGFAVDEATRSTFGLHFYDSVLVAEKRPMQPPQRLQSGRPSL